MNTVIQDIDFCASRLKVMAEPNRFAVVAALMDHPQDVSALSEALNIEQSLLSHHLRVLRESGLVEVLREGRRAEYRLAAGVKRTGRTLDLGCCQLVFS